MGQWIRKLQKWTSIEKLWGNWYEGLLKKNNAAGFESTGIYIMLPVMLANIWKNDLTCNSWEDIANVLI